MLSTICAAASPEPSRLGFNFEGYYGHGITYLDTGRDRHTKAHVSTPRVAQVRGMDRFRGRVIHSSQWVPGTSVEGLRVGVVGTGATAVQLVPELAKTAAEVVVFQR